MQYVRKRAIKERIILSDFFDVLLVGGVKILKSNEENKEEKNNN